MLYICPQCGKWLFSLGIGEAFALSVGADYMQRCADCKILMQAYGAEEHIKIIPKRARSAPTTPTTETRRRAPQVLSYDREKNKRRKH